MSEVPNTHMLFIETLVWELGKNEKDNIEIEKFIYNEKRHATDVIFRNKTTNELVRCTFKPHGIREYNPVDDDTELATKNIKPKGEG